MKPFALFVSSDSAHPHPPGPPVYSGPPAALQCGGTQPGAGGHVHLPASAPSAQGNCPLPSLSTHDSCKIACNIMEADVIYIAHILSSWRFQTATGLRFLRRAAAVDLRVTPPLHPCPPHPVPPHPVPLPQTSPIPHRTLKMHLWMCNKVSLLVVVH